jgi:hypothetical protein
MNFRKTPLDVVMKNNCTEEVSEEPTIVESDNMDVSKENSDMEITLRETKVNDGSKIKKSASPKQNAAEKKSLDESVLSKSWSQAYIGKVGQPIDAFVRDESEPIHCTKESTNKIDSDLVSKESEDRLLEESDHSDSESDRPKNDFIDDQAEEIDDYSSGDSMSTNERESMQNNEITVKGIDLGSDDTHDGSIDGEEESDDDSFIVSDEVDESLSEIEEEEEDVKHKKKRRRIVSVTSSDNDNEEETIKSPSSSSNLESQIKQNSPEKSDKLNENEIEKFQPIEVQESPRKPASVDENKDICKTPEKRTKILKNEASSGESDSFEKEQSKETLSNDQKSPLKPASVDENKDICKTPEKQDKIRIKEASSGESDSIGKKQSKKTLKKDQKSPHKTPEKFNTNKEINKAPNSQNHQGSFKTVDHKQNDVADFEKKEKVNKKRKISVDSDDSSDLSKQKNTQQKRQKFSDTADNADSTILDSSEKEKLSEASITTPVKNSKIRKTKSPAKVEKPEIEKKIAIEKVLSTCSEYLESKMLEKKQKKALKRQRIEEKRKLKEEGVGDDKENEMSVIKKKKSKKSKNKKQIPVGEGLYIFFKKSKVECFRSYIILL